MTRGVEPTTGGIGTALCQGFAGCGARVIGADRNAPDSMPEGAMFRTVDLLDHDSIAALAESIDGPVDVLVNNAAISSDVEPAARIGLESWRRVMANNRPGAFVCSKIFGRVDFFR